ncbi:putative selenate ABC transporter substrate-binding protein [Caloramator australicus]|jgi:phosphonate transport system substrate-binding protein|uniref:Phosphonate ABC transporter phosphate-binding periplasmic component (TC 3.A.1.9.1) n=1 Tax=Caloramator australicus RC3 TaxID=857293 RepID=G0V3N0_9CLOT|nr:putative selenate ABC transporter substrate-binding protein [Caloramator australicus]CCC57720.1 Phosphonate ABC transporter phosphate-binding periplasmic component (TC 3.A.1.9.1) [Caloramator australicus RC3]
MKKILSVLLSLFFIFSFTSCSNNSNLNKPTFKIGALPDQNASELTSAMTKMAEYLSNKTGLKVEYVQSVDYAALVTAFERGEIHLAWFGGLTGVQARNKVPTAEAIAQRPRDAEFHSVFIVQKNLPVNSIKDLKGLTFTFGSESSTSGHLMPRYYLLENGIYPEKDFNGKPNYSGSHDKTYKLVESGAFQAGVLNEAVWQKAVKDGKVDLSKVRAFYTTPAYFDYNWTINGNVDEIFGNGTKDKVKNAILSMGESEKEILDFFQTDKFIETKNDNYNAIESVAKQLGIIK